MLHCNALLAANQDTAFMLSIAWSTVQMLMSNFFVTLKDMRFKWISGARWGSALYFSFEGLAVAEFKGAAFDCSAGVDPSGVTFLKQLMPNSRFLGMSAVTNALTNPGRDCVADTDAVLRYYGFKRTFGATVGVLCGYWALTHAATYFVMTRVARKEQR